MSGYASTSAIPPPGNSGVGTIEIPLGPTNQPRVLVRSLNRDEAIFHLSGVEGGLANALRRVVMADVPTVGECLDTSSEVSLEVV